jgi:phosphopantothenoylcysteine synthetase/decarboxylase
MVEPRTIELYTDDRVFIDLWDRSATVDRIPHIQLVLWADLFVVVPATADIIGKAANGIADDLLSTAILSSPKPVIFAPAMNRVMWESRVVQRNIRTLRQDGHYVVPPENAMSVTSGEWDQALTSSPDSILPHLQHVRMKELREGYWEEATSTKPQTPAQKRIRELVLDAERRVAGE